MPDTLREAARSMLRVLEAISASHPALIADNMPDDWGMERLRRAWAESKPVQGKQLEGPAEGQRLCGELEAFCREQMLPFRSPEELLLRRGLGQEQRSFLEGIHEAWERYMRSSAAHQVRLKSPLELAGAYVAELRASMTDDDFENCWRRVADPDDLCDSNIVMATAFMRLHGRDLWIPSDVARGRCTFEELDADGRLWSAAVDLVERQRAAWR